MKNEAGLRPMKRAFGTRRGYRALRFTVATPPLHTSRRLVLHIRAANASLLLSPQYQTRRQIRTDLT